MQVKSFLMSVFFLASISAFAVEGEPKYAAPAEHFKALLSSPAFSAQLSKTGMNGVSKIKVDGLASCSNCFKFEVSFRDLATNTGGNPTKVEAVFTVEKKGETFNVVSLTK